MPPENFSIGWWSSLAQEVQNWTLDLRPASCFLVPILFCSSCSLFHLIKWILWNTIFPVAHVKTLESLLTLLFLANSILNPLTSPIDSTWILFGKIFRIWPVLTTLTITTLLYEWKCVASCTGWVSYLSATCLLGFSFCNLWNVGSHCTSSINLWKRWNECKGFSSWWVVKICQLLLLEHLPSMQLRPVSV